MVIAAQFLIVEDNPQDIKNTEDYFKEYKITNQLNIITQHEEALRYLRRQGEYADANLPDIVLVSFSLLQDNAKKLLHDIKADAALRHIPLMLLTAPEGEEIAPEEQLLIDGCVPKPFCLAHLTSALKSLDDFWLTIVK